MGGDSWQNFDTLESYIFKTQKAYRHSRGDFSDILRRIAMATKIIAAKVQRAGLLDVLGSRGRMNIQGEEQMKLDAMANEVMLATFSWMPSIAGIGTEEEEDFICFPRQENYQGMRYIILFDPLDGSSNIDGNVPVGTIFSVYRCVSDGKCCNLSDFLQGGVKQAAAGYVIYGSSTMFVYTTGNGVHGFTLDPEVGEYSLSHENIKLPDRCLCISVNESNYTYWDKATQQYVDFIREKKDDRYQRTTSRYIGSLVADFHRNLLYGGVFLYPSDRKSPRGKLRLLYECAPLAMIAEQAGGLALDSTKPILDIIPTSLHQRTPLVIGNREDVLRYQQFIQEYRQSY